jgi:glycosyltransferase involved in cell wall biosynthesis
MSPRIAVVWNLLSDADGPAMRLLIVIPAFNEEDALEALLEEVLSTRARLPCASDVVVIDDGSSDGTARVATACGVRLVRLCRNVGIGGAVQTGLRLAWREGFDYAVQIDGDGQHPPMEIARLVRPESRGRRRPTSSWDPGGWRRVDISLRLRGRLGQIWLRAWLYVVCRLTATDPTSGFRLYGPRALAFFQKSYPYDFPEPESLAAARAGGLRIVDEPVGMRAARRGGRSSIGGLQSVYYMIKVTLAVALAYLRNRGRPAALAFRQRRDYRPPSRPRQMQIEAGRYWPFAVLCSVVLLVVGRRLSAARTHHLQGSISYLAFLSVFLVAALFPDVAARIAARWASRCSRIFCFASRSWRWVSCTCGRWWRLSRLETRTCTSPRISRCWKASRTGSPSAVRTLAAVAGRPRATELPLALRRGRPRSARLRDRLWVVGARLRRPLG